MVYQEFPAQTIYRERAVRLFKYLRGLSEIRSKTIRDLSNYEKVLWLGEIPKQAGCFCVAWNDETGNELPEVWIEVEQPKPRVPCPALSAPLRRWVEQESLQHSDREAPVLREQIQTEDRNDSTTPEDVDTPVTYDNLVDYPEIQTEWDDYLRFQWRPWATLDRERARQQSVYGDLFSLYQRQQRLGEQYEVVLGLGLLRWKTESGHEVNRHLVVAQSTVSFDSVRGRLSVAPAADGSKLAFEEDMLEAQERPDINEQASNELLLHELGDDISNRSLWSDLLSSWVHAVSSRGTYIDELSADLSSNSDPSVTFAPALLLRKRTERSLIRVFDEIVDQLSNDEVIPTGVMRLLQIADDKQNAELEVAEPNLGAFESEIYFPLPANEEQTQIVQRLQTRQGVLVQGPPGTGKSHTIVNLVCHLLASGKRVLVTSHTPRALSVLQEKMPEEISSLCVSLLGNDVTALKNLEDSVHGITDRFDSWDPTRNKKTIERLLLELDEARRAEASALHELRKIRERETYVSDLQYGGYSGTAAAIARRISEERAKFDWLLEESGTDTECPVTSQEALLALQFLREFPPGRIEASRGATPPIESLPSPEVFDFWVEREHLLGLQVNVGVSHQNHPAFTAILELPASNRKHILAETDNLFHLSAPLQRKSGWEQQATHDVLVGRPRAWRELLGVTSNYLAIVDNLKIVDLDQNPVGIEGRELANVRDDANALCEHLRSGGKLGFGPFRPEQVKRGQYLLNDARIGGMPCNSVEVLQSLISWIGATESLKNLKKLWVSFGVVTNGPSSFQIAQFQDARIALEAVLRIDEFLSGLKNELTNFIKLDEPAWEVGIAVSAFAAALRQAEAVKTYEEARIPLLDLEASVSKIQKLADLHPVSVEVLSAVRNRSESDYLKAYRQLEILKMDREAIVVGQSRLALFSEGAPNVTKQLGDSPAAPEWDERCLGFESAWNWVRANKWLDQLSDPAAESRQSLVVEESRERILQTTRKLAAEKAWRACFERMTETERQYLMAWVASIRRFGSGFSKRAGQHRRDAQRNMEQCRSAIPGWIMPIYRVAETIRPGVDAFDVVIVDEASQSGPEALFLQYIAKQVVVVGDDKQISPEFIGINRDDVDVLRKRYLEDIPHNEALGIDNSFFDQAVIRYGGRIRLREHFRCMPEIIQFSNNLCYRSEPLIPLRQYGADRLPPIRVVRVFDGYRAGSETKVINPPEAQALVDQLVQCCKDPAYAGLSMGVISLQGPYQAKKIEELLVERLSPEEINSRKILCGDAYDFQGDERDVIFLSLVAAPTQRIGTLSSARDERRFNVAMSRARDQVWLFHTATLNDLSPKCLRYRLLEYCQNPKVEQIEFAGVEVSDDRLIAPFESLFEQRVYRQIVQRGYRVIPQYEIANYRIDLVVDGLQGRLAVECDGDQWHGPEEFESDMARQRQLERCGWTFWRVRGSTYFRNSDSALQGLWDRLDQLGIFPDMHEMSKHVMGDDSSREFSARSQRKTDDRISSLNPLDSVIADEIEESTSIETDQETQAFVEAIQPSGPLAPFKAWQITPLPDPNECSLEVVLQGLSEIISTEGPMTCRRAYQLYLAACGIDRMTPQVRSVLNRALYRGVQLRILADRDEIGSEGQIDRIVRVAQGPNVIVRERGPRALNEIPPSEIAEAMNKVALAIGKSDDKQIEQLFAKVLDLYDLERSPESEFQNEIMQRAVSQLSSRFRAGATRSQLGLDLNTE